jgi:hypothetical protein
MPSCKYPKEILGVVVIYHKARKKKTKSGITTYHEYTIQPKIGSDQEPRYTSDEVKALDIAGEIADGLCSGIHQANQGIAQMSPADVSNAKEFKKLEDEAGLPLLPLLRDEILPGLKQLKAVNVTLKEAIDFMVKRMSFAPITVEEAVARYLSHHEGNWSNEQYRHVKGSLSILVAKYGTTLLINLSLKEIADSKILWKRINRTTKARVDAGPEPEGIEAI